MRIAVEGCDLVLKLDSPPPPNKKGWGSVKAIVWSAKISCSSFQTYSFILKKKLLCVWLENEAQTVCGEGEGHAVMQLLCGLV